MNVWRILRKPAVKVTENECYSFYSACFIGAFFTVAAQILNNRAITADRNSISGDYDNVAAPATLGSICMIYEGQV